MSFLQAVQKQYHRYRQPAKALTGHPELAGRVHLISQSAGAEVIALNDYTDYAKVYQAYVWVSKAVGKTAQTISRLKVRVVTEAGELPGHPVSQLLGYINPSTPPDEFWEAYIVNMLTAGEFAAEVVENGRGVPVELWARRPDKLQVWPDKSQPNYNQVAGYTWGGDDNKLTPAQLWHDKFYNPLNEWRGLSPLQAVRQGIIIDIFAQAWAKKFLEGGARPDFAVIAPQGITKTERETLEATIIAKFSGADNWHKPIILEEGITDLKPFSFAPKDTEWLAQREFSRDEVAAIFGMPDEIMGFGRDTYENFNTAWRVWWLLTLKPLIDHRDNALTTFFSRTRPMLKPGERIATDVSEIGALQDDITGQIDNAIKFINVGIPFQVVNERFRLGFAAEVEPVKPEPVVVAAPPVEAVQPVDTEPPAAPGAGKGHPHIHTKDLPAAYADWQKVAITAHGKGWAQKPYFNDDIPVSHSYRLAVVLGLCRSKEAIDHVFAHFDEYTKGVGGVAEDVSPARMAQENAFIEAIEGWLAGQVKRIADRTRQTNAAPDNDFWQAETAALTAFITPLAGQWVEAAIAEAAGTLGAVGLGLDININARAAEWAGKYSLELARGLTATTKEVARAKIKNWAVSGRDFPSLVDDLQAIIASRWRAELIASTEVTRAYAEVALQAADEYDVIKGVTFLTARDDRVCPVCGPLHGATAKKGGTFAGGVTSPPLHPRCRCWLGFSL